MKKTIAVMGLVSAVIMVGCNTTDTNTFKQYGADGKLVSETVTTSDGPSIAKKSYNIINQTTAMKIKTTPDTSSASTSWIELIFGTSVTSVQMVTPVKEGEKTPASYNKTVQTSIWADIFGTSVASGTESYTAASSETADETAKRIKALRDGSIANTSTASATSSTASSASTSTATTSTAGVTSSTTTDSVVSN